MKIKSKVKFIRNYKIPLVPYLRINSGTSGIVTANEKIFNSTYILVRIKKLGITVATLPEYLRIIEGENEN